ncbi:MAG: hypothetical protein H0X24_13790 [Ktedonobacterales bacterium]|nr:hypothetical protein [Ktedonobacterales bacterium]
MGAKTTNDATSSWLLKGTLELAGEAGFGYYLLGGTRLRLGKSLAIFIGKHAVVGTLEALTVGADHPDNTYYLSHMRICVGEQMPQHVLYYCDSTKFMADSVT